MKLIKIIPYAMFGSILFAGSGQSSTNQNTTNAIKQDTLYTKKYKTELVMPTQSEHITAMNNMYLDSKTDTLVDTYVSNMLRAYETLNPLLGKNGYSAAVRKELPGAPVGQHCVWGQYTQLSRALTEMGDTLTIIPKDARTACVQFKSKMREKYQDTPNCIHEGRIFESDSAYNVALHRFLLKQQISMDTPDSVRQSAEQKFADKNFSADSLAPGTILIVPRHRGSRNAFHAIMLLGRGRIENKQFIPDSTGRHIYVGHNRENLGDLFKIYDTSNVFAADTRSIVRNEYAKELDSLESMTNDELCDFLADNQASPLQYKVFPRAILLQMARNKYFNIDQTIQQKSFNFAYVKAPTVYDIMRDYKNAKTL